MTKFERYTARAIARDTHENDSITVPVDAQVERTVNGDYFVQARIYISKSEMAEHQTAKQQEETKP